MPPLSRISYRRCCTSLALILHPDFDPDEVDHDMHEWLMGVIEEGDLQVIDLKKDGYSEQEVRLFKRPAGKVLRELLADLAGCQHFAFKEYKDASGA